MKKAGFIGILLFAAGLLLFCVSGLLALPVPMGRDQGVAAYVAEVMARGGAPYREVFHFNLPGIFFAYRAAMFSGLPWPEAANLAHLLAGLLTCFAVFLAARKVVSRPYAGLAAFFFASFFGLLYTTYWNLAQKESFAAPALGFALWFGLVLLLGPGETGNGWEDKAGDGGSALPKAGVFAFLFGLFCGLAAQAKPTLGLALAAALYPAWRYRGFRLRALLIVAGSGLGFALSFVPLLVYAIERGILGLMAESVFRFGGFYGGQNYEGFSQAAGLAAKSLFRLLFDWRFLFTAAAGTLAAGRLGRGESRTPVGFVWLFFFLLLAQVVVQMKFFTYHWEPLLVPLSIIAAAGCERVFQGAREAREENAGRLRSFVFFCLAALFLGNLLPESGRLWREYLYFRGMIDDVGFLSPYGSWGRGDLCPLAQNEAAAYLRARTRPSDPVLIFGHELGLYVLAKRFAPTRFAYDQPLNTDPRGDARFAAYRERLRREFLRDLLHRPPLYIVVIEHDQTSIEPEDSFTQMQSFPEFRDFLSRNYELETIIEDYRFYRRIPRGSEGRKER